MRLFCKHHSADRGQGIANGTRKAAARGGVPSVASTFLFPGLGREVIGNDPRIPFLLLLWFWFLLFRRKKTQTQTSAAQQDFCPLPAPSFAFYLPRWGLLQLGLLLLLEFFELLPFLGFFLELSSCFGRRSAFRAWREAETCRLKAAGTLYEQC